MGERGWNDEVGAGGYVRWGLGSKKPDMEDEFDQISFFVV